MRKLRCKECGEITYTPNDSIEKCPFCDGKLRTDLKIVPSKVDEDNDVGC